MRRAVRPAAAALLLLAFGAAPAVANAAEAPPAAVFRWLSGELGTTAAALLIFLGLPVLGALGTWGLNQVALARAKQRDFVENTGKKVVDLAWTHYWALANATGTLAGHLTNHLRLVDAHLLVSWEAHAAMRERMAQLARDTERDSFLSFVRLVHAFEGFQFRDSNTYLLPHHAAGEALRRLYNRFVESLGELRGRALTDIRLAVERRLAGAAAPKDLGSPQFEVEAWFAGGEDDPAMAWDETELQRRLADARAAWRTWLETQPGAVADAADSLHAFSRLLTHELARLHEVWHRDRGPLALKEAWRQAQAATARGAWPDVLDARAVETIRRARTLSPYFAPLGGRSDPVRRREEAEKPPQPQAPQEPEQAVEQPAAAAPAGPEPSPDAVGGTLSKAAEGEGG